MDLWERAKIALRKYIKENPERVSKELNELRNISNGNSSLQLDKLEKKLNDVLAKETPETIIKWLEEKRHENKP